jgi:hypothetical protein
MTTRTFRPITKFNRIQLGEENSAFNTFFNLKLKNASIDIFINFIRNVQQNNELTIETDQNLQKYFITESDGDCLKIKLDYLDDEYSNINPVKQNNFEQLVKNGENFLIANKNIKMNLKTTNSFVYVSKKDFETKINFFIDPILSKNFITSNISLNCTDNKEMYLIDNKRFGVNRNTQLIKKEFPSSSYLSVNYCDETFALYFSQNVQTCLFKAFRNYSFS